MCEFVLYFGAFGTLVMIVFLTERSSELFAGYLQGYQLDPCVVITLHGGGLGAHGLWVQPMGDNISGFVQPIWLAAY